MPLTFTALLSRAVAFPSHRHNRTHSARLRRLQRRANSASSSSSSVVSRCNRVGLGAPSLPSARTALTGSLLAAFAAATFVPGRAMAWRSSGRTNDELIDNLHRNDVMTDVSIAHAMKSVDRANYVVPGSGDPYQDSPQPIGYGATISAPHMHAHCLEVLRDWLKPGARRGLSSTHTNHHPQKIIRPSTVFIVRR